MMQCKAIFVWDEPRPVVEVPDRLRFRPVAAEGDTQTLRGAIEAVLADTADRALRHSATSGSSVDAAEPFLSPDPVFAFEPNWWRLAHDADDRLVGFSQPVAFKGCERDGKDEVTLLLMGVLPEHRGRGFAVDILADATADVQRRGAWRIFCDTDIENEPMCAAFRRVGYRQDGEREVPLVR